MSLMCRCLGVSRSAYYAWRDRGGRSARASSDAELQLHIREIHERSSGRYGSPRVHAQLLRDGVRTSKKRVERLMREANLRGKIRRRFRKTTDSRHELPIAPNLLNRQFLADAPDHAWVGDITYIWTDAGWIYLAVLIDLHSRMVVGWALATHLRTELPVEALRRALGSREPSHEMLHHTDRGCQYASIDYRKLLEQHGIVVSMSRAGDCYDNAVAESFFGSLKQELVHHERWSNLEEAHRAIHEYIDVFYNRQRLHSSLGYRTPAEVDQEVA